MGLSLRIITAVARCPAEFDFVLLLQLFQISLNGPQRQIQSGRYRIRPAAWQFGDVAENLIYCAIYCAIYYANPAAAMLFQGTKDFA